jgi:hypothetical protein
VPAVRIDADASEVVSMTSNDASALKPVVADAITSTVSSRTDLPKPARFRVVVTGKAETNTSGVLTCSVPLALTVVMIVFPLLICPNNLWSADVALTVETSDGAVLQGDGHGEVTLGYAGENADVAAKDWQNAVYNAVQDAMLHLKPRAGKVASQ